MDMKDSFSRIVITACLLFGAIVSEAVPLQGNSNYSKTERILRAEVLKVDIVPFTSPTTGSQLKMVQVQLKNVGTIPIRMLKGIYKIKDSQGNKLDEIEYIIFADSDDRPGLLPQTQWGTPKNEGFIIPNLYSGREANVEVVITKAAEFSGM